MSSLRGTTAALPRLLFYAAAAALGAYAASLTQARAPLPQPEAAQPRTVVQKPAAKPKPTVRATPVHVSAQPDPLRAVPSVEAPPLPVVPAERDAQTVTERPDFKDGLLVTGATPHRIVLFSFDDGPDPRTTPLLLDRLDEAGIKALFFLVGSRLGTGTPIEREQASIARDIARRGHIIGGHTLDHVQLPLLSTEEVQAQLNAADERFERTLGTRPVLFRPPFGAHSERIDQILAGRGYTTVLWNLGAGDFQVRSAEEVYQIWQKIFERRERENGDRGGIILLHDTYAWSVDAFQMIVSHLMAKNCELYEQGDELYDIVDDLTFFYVPRSAADAAGTEAPPARLDPKVLKQRQAALRERTAQRCLALAAN